MFKIKTDASFEVECPPGAPNENTPCHTNWEYCKDCKEMFNRLPTERRAWLFFKKWAKEQGFLHYYGSDLEVKNAWGITLSKDAMIRSQDDFFFEGWALFVELGGRMIVLGHKVET